MSASPDWRRSLGPMHIEEIKAATQTIVKQGKDWRWVTKARFPLATTRELLDDIAHELEHGCGLVTLAGLPVHDFDHSSLCIAWAGLGCHLGTLRSQNSRGQLLRPIQDEGVSAGARYGQMIGDNDVFLSSRARTASTAALRYHTDRVDVVALLCVHQARSGGINRIASAVSVHNAMLERRPDLATLLYQDIYRSRLGEEEGGENLFYPLPVFSQHRGHFTTHYSRTYVEAAQRLPQVPKMTPQQWEALDLLADLCDELCLENRLIPGDMQFLNNHVIYHSRTPFDNGDSPQEQRLLYRLWLSVPNSRPLPENHAVLWGKVDAGALRGGIHPRASQ